MESEFFEQQTITAVLCTLQHNEAKATSEFSYCDTKTRRMYIKKKIKTQRKNVKMKASNLIPLKAVNKPLNRKSQVYLLF